jgi:release factor glutamine methyltransferase
VTRREVLDRARELLAEKNIPDADWETELLLRDTLKISRAQLYAEPQLTVTPLKETEFWAKIERCLEGEPAAYIIGRREFYGLDFWVDDGVLIPRPETELLVEKTLERAHGYQSVTIADIGTGCGAIAISLALNLPDARVYAIDISQRALNTARCNCERHDIRDRVRLCAGDLLEPLPGPVDIIVANLPYIATGDLPLVNTRGFEPQLALHGGKDGLDVIRRLCEQSVKLLNPGGSLLLEFGMGQKDTVVELLRHLFPSATVEVYPDLRKIDRVVCMKLPGAALET